MKTPSPDALQKLIDIEEIRTLKYRYAALCDRDYAPDELASLFTADGIWDGGSLGRAEGRDGIRDFFTETGRLVSFAIHYMTNPIIEVDGDRATGSWYLWQSLVIRETQQAYWLMAKYRDDYVREGGVWKFAHLRLQVDSLTRYEDGPGKLRFTTDLS